ncbi:right-handed parallel beta-helix repeat-containing protein [Porifericola rhodea]|uniref:right-handed parallel beta-helix repeat-containing protein n=1 Tax=Porifericola rhodea TaxID=930972 RepID=UPI0026656085|nr:right-handed parallel beta-helix repeat-containing protein [Porifericola rhodea]WKN33257.1 right-handed parallel beta-helix repeat-containing protein [Porifericola rhodea]
MINSIWRWCGLFIFSFSMFWAACTPEEEIISKGKNLKLSFDQDTLAFDTLFSAQKSITRVLTVYNRSDKAVETNISLAGGTNSAFSVFVNGKAGVSFDDVLLRGKDSLIILAEAFIDPRNESLPFLVEDSLQFETNGNLQSIKLLGWGQDAVFIDNWHIKEDTHLLSDKPYVINDSIWVDKDVTLTIPKSSRLYFARDAKLWVDGSLAVEGKKEEEVLFTYEREDGIYANGPGQWEGIILSDKSKAHKIDYAQIRNAEVGIYILQTDEDTIPDLRISNTIIENMSVNGILAANADIDGFNLLVTHCMVNSVGNFGNGYYRYRHCTFANDVNPYARQGATLYFSDLLEANASSQSFQLVLENNIIWGNMEEELVLSVTDPASELEVKNNLLKLPQSSPWLEQNILNKEPQFNNPVIYVYTIDSTSAAIDKGVVSTINLDLAENARDEKPDLGAYEYIQTEP